MSDNPQEQVHYCRLALPEDAKANLPMTRIAMSKVFAQLEHRLVDPSKGEFRITYSMDSALKREAVIAEWRPRVKPKADEPSPHRDIMPFMTVIPSRRPTNKLHLTIGHAKNAINNAMYGTGTRGSRDRMELCEWIDGKGWDTKYDLPVGTTECDLPWRKK